MKPTAQKYRTTNWKAYNEALKARGSLLVWLDPEMCWHGKLSGKRGRSQKYSDEAIQFCLTIKSLFNLPLRQAMGMAQSLLKLASLDWQVPDFSTVSRRQKHPAVTIEAQATTTGLHLLVDSSGIKMLGEGEWKTKKHGADYRRQWRKVHLGIDASTLEIRAIEVTDNATGDAPMLLRKTPVPVQDILDGEHHRCGRELAAPPLVCIRPAPGKRSRPGTASRLLDPAKPGEQIRRTPPVLPQDRVQATGQRRRHT